MINNIFTGDSGAKGFGPICYFAYYGHTTNNIACFGVHEFVHKSHTVRLSIGELSQGFQKGTMATLNAFVFKCIFDACTQAIMC